MVGLLNWGSGAVGGGGAVGQERAVGCDVEEARGEGRGEGRWPWQVLNWVIKKADGLGRC